MRDDVTGNQLRYTVDMDYDVDDTFKTMREAVFTVQAADVANQRNR